MGADAALTTAPILYPYQQRYLRDASRWKAGMWSRQTGKTFTTTLEAVLDCLEAEAQGRARRWTVMSISQARAQDAIEQAKVHLRAVRAAFEALEVPMDLDLLAFEVRLPHGSRIRAIAAKPETARGMSDNLILDEFAHHQQDRELWRAVMPVVSRPDLKLRIISTPNGKGNLFYQIMSGAMKVGGVDLFSRHVVSIHDAVAQGLPRNIPELRAATLDPTTWAQEYECTFVDAAAAWLPFDLIASCEDALAGQPSAYGGGPCFIGMDFAARGDLTVIVVLEDVAGVLWCRELVTLRAVSFSEQLVQLDRLMAHYHVVRAALDQTGMGEMPVQEAQRRHGAYRAEGVLFTAARKLDMATELKRRMDDGRLRLPIDDALRQDLHQVQRQAGPSGAPRLVSERTELGHADRFWALALAASAAAGERPVYAYESLGRRRWANEDNKDATWM